MTLVGKFDETALRVFNMVQFEILSSQKINPEKREKVDKRGTNFEKYHALLAELAEKYAVHTPSKFSDAEIERDFLRLRVKLFYNLDATPVRELPSETEEECARKLRLLQEFAVKIKRRAAL